MILLALSVFCVLATQQASIVIWTFSYAVMSLLWVDYGDLGWVLKSLLAAVFAVLLVSSIPSLRRNLVSSILIKYYRRAMPSMSSTERDALEAGTVGWEGQLFSGNPDFTRLDNIKPVCLTPEEQAFMEGPVNTLCRMIDDWDITHQRSDMSPEMWTFLKENRFFGMLIPKEFGGLGFSATAQMSVLVKIYTCSASVATTVGVPNSLGPAELLLKYGTEEQKNYYLPRLADGREIPCFALTNPNAGSDAAAIPDKGIVCHEMVNGESILGIRLNWDKRYITLAPVATLVGLAFRLFDPDNILGKGTRLGISCALIPANTEGVKIGRRHFPLNIAFLNGPTQGKDVFIPMDYLIGGADLAGQGWRMLMECLSAGRAVSLPSCASGGAQIAALVTGAYARIRKQFNLPIGRFEGIEEGLARIAMNAYIIDAGLSMTAAAIDAGEKSAVAGAILKYHTTERSRQSVIDAMDIHGGKGICLGPNNYLGRGYQTIPIAITVEGANILTRSLIIFGQGAIRCHPFVLQEINSAKANQLSVFDQAIWGHVSHFMANFVKSIGYSWTNARLLSVQHQENRRYYQLLRRYSAHLAFLTDFSMFTLGGELKRREKISARLGDLLSMLYLTSAVLKRFQTDGSFEADLPVVNACCQELMNHCDEAIEGLIKNYPIRIMRPILKMIVQPFGIRQAKPSDRLGHVLAKILTEPNETRNRITRLTFTEPGEHSPAGRTEAAFHKVCAIEALEKRISKAVKTGLLHALTFHEQIEEARIMDIIDKDEFEQLKEAEEARQAVIAVDDFDYDDLSRLRLSAEKKKEKSSKFG